MQIKSFLPLLFQKLIIIGVKDSGKNFTFKPSSDYLFKEGDCLIAMGALKDYEAAKSELFFS